MTYDRTKWRGYGTRPEPEQRALILERASWPGLSAERVRLSKPQELFTRFQTRTHFLALHDIVRTDGETKIVGFERSASRDVRGTLTYAPPGVSIESWSKFRDRRSSVLTVFLDPDIDEANELRANDLPARLYFQNQLVKQSSQKVSSLMSSPFVHENTYAEHLALVILCELRNALVENQKAPALKGGLSPRELDRVRDYVTAGLETDISLSDLAKLIDVSKFHFVRAFRKSTGMAPYQFVLATRVERAKEMLADPHCKISTVATSVGFHSIRQFDRIFLRLMGVTPSFYRDQIAPNICTRTGEPE